MTTIACRTATVDETPRTASSLRRLAEAAGWTTRATFAAHDGRSSFALRMTSPQGHYAVAVWTDGKADVVWLLAHGLGPQRVKLAQMREVLA